MSYMKELVMKADEVCAACAAKDQEHLADQCLKCKIEVVMKNRKGEDIRVSLAGETKEILDVEYA